MDKETLSNYGWIVICILVLSVMIALATPFGSYIAKGFKSTYVGFEQTTGKATTVMNASVGEKIPASCGIEGHYKGDGKEHIKVSEYKQSHSDYICNSNHEYVCQCSSWTVPEDGTYTMKTAINGKSVYNAGEKLPCGYIAKDNDVYTNTDYKYTCDGNGWSVKVNDKTKTSYGIILSEIAGKPLTKMNSAFEDCTSLTNAPIIPNSVTNMNNAFAYCTSLTKVPKISNSTTLMYQTFYRCSSLTTAPIIPNSVTSLLSTFSGCTSLTTVLSIPDSVTNMSYTFNDCKSLVTAPTIPSSVTNMGGVFSGCTSLTTAPVIPDSVADMNSTFAGCTSLTTAPTIPNSVTNMSWTFANCTSLTGTITINANPTNYSNCFKFTTQLITLTGSSTKLTELAKTSDRINITVQQ